MIPQNEVRVNNYVRFRGKSVRATVDMIAMPDELHPLQISPGSLKKLRFKEDAGSFYIDWNGTRLFISHQKNGIWITSMGHTWKREIRYIHELQNVFYGLFGVELLRDPRL